MPTTKKRTIPTNLGELADLYDKIRAERIAIDKLSEEKKAYESTLRAALIEGLKKANLSVAGGTRVRATLGTKHVPQVRDWTALYEYVRKHRAFELLQKRISTTAVVERWDSGKTVDGIDAIVVDDLSINKL
jgi:hypothetical protein